MGALFTRLSSGIQFRYNCVQLNEKAPIDLSAELKEVEVVLQLGARKAEKGAVVSRVGGGGNYKERHLNFDQ